MPENIVPDTMRVRYNHHDNNGEQKFDVKLFTGSIRDFDRLVEVNYQQHIDEPFRVRSGREGSRVYTPHEMESNSVFSCCYPYPEQREKQIVTFELNKAEEPDQNNVLAHTVLEIPKDSRVPARLVCRDDNCSPSKIIASVFMDHAKALEILNEKIKRAEQRRDAKRERGENPYHSAWNELHGTNSLELVTADGTFNLNNKIGKPGYECLRGNIPIFGGSDPNRELPLSKAIEEAIEKEREWSLNMFKKLQKEREAEERHKRRMEGMHEGQRTGTSLSNEERSRFVSVKKELTEEINNSGLKQAADAFRDFIDERKEQEKQSTQTVEEKKNQEEVINVRQKIGNIERTFEQLTPQESFCMYLMHLNDLAEHASSRDSRTNQSDAIKEFQRINKNLGKILENKGLIQNKDGTLFLPDYSSRRMFDAYAKPLAFDNLDKISFSKNEKFQYVCESSKENTISYEDAIKDVAKLYDIDLDKLERKKNEQRILPDLHEVHVSQPTIATEDAKQPLTNLGITTELTEELGKSFIQQINEQECIAVTPEQTCYSLKFEDDKIVGREFIENAEAFNSIKDANVKLDIEQAQWLQNGNKSKESPYDRYNSSLEKKFKENPVLGNFERKSEYSFGIEIDDKKNNMSFTASAEIGQKKTLQRDQCDKMNFKINNNGKEENYQINCTKVTALARALGAVEKFTEAGIEASHKLERFFTNIRDTAIKYSPAQIARAEQTEISKANYAKEESTITATLKDMGNSVKEFAKKMRSLVTSKGRDDSQQLSSEQGR